MIGRFEFLRIKPELMSDGVDWSDTYQPYLIASAEKVLVDAFYIATRKNRRFLHLPELGLARAFRRREFERLLQQLPYPVRIRFAIASRWQQLQD